MFSQSLCFDRGYVLAAGQISIATSAPDLRQDPRLRQAYFG